MYSSSKTFSAFSNSDDIKTAGYGAVDQTGESVDAGAEFIRFGLKAVGEEDKPAALSVRALHPSQGDFFAIIPLNADGRRLVQVCAALDDAVMQSSG